MIDISDWAIEEKNKVSTGNVWMHMIEITWPSEVTPFRITGNNEAVTWDSHTWTSYPVVVGEINHVAGEIPQCSLDIANATSVMEAYITGYAYWMKTNGNTPATVKIMIVNSGNLAETTPETTHEFEVVTATIDKSWATLTLGVPNKYKKRFPEYLLVKNQCQYRTFKGAECGYAGATTTCDRTLATCRTLSNSGRYGGFPGVGDDIYRGVA